MCPISSFIVSCIKTPLIMPQCCDTSTDPKQCIEKFTVPVPVTPKLIP